MVSKFYEQFGFKQTSAAEAKSVWELAVAEYALPKCFIQNDET